ANAGNDGQIVQAAMHEPVSREPNAVAPKQPDQLRVSAAREATAAPQTRLPVNGTVVLDVEQGGIEVPPFLGKTVRSAVEAAQDAGLELEAVGSGVARQQSPAAGTHVPAGSRVTVQFGR